jgi:hypothetical protein
VTNAEGQSSDRVQVEEALQRYCRGADRSDEALVRSAFWPDATDERFGDAVGKIEDVIPVMMALRGRMLSATHFLTNVSISLADQTAHSEAYLTVFYRYVDGGAEYEWVVGARYIDDFEKRAAAWKIAHRQSLVEWSRVSKIDQAAPPESLLKI